MTRCDQARDLFSDHLEHGLAVERAQWLEDHLAHCDECRALYRELRTIVTIAGSAADVSPPSHLDEEISSSPCRRWLGLLFAAVDREIDESNLDRLFVQLESCEGCRRAWADLSVIHQVSQSIEPPQHLFARCLRPRRRQTTQFILGRRTATAAAYALAILASLVIGNPVSLARHDAAETVQKVSAAVGADLGGVARKGRGEARVMLWRALNLGRRAADAVNTTWSKLVGSPEDGRGQGARHDEPILTPQRDPSGPPPAADQHRGGDAGSSWTDTTMNDRQLALAPAGGVAEKEHRS